MNTLSQNVAKNLVKLRINHKLTQQELANKLNLTKATIANYEAGNRNPSFDILEKFSEIFSVPVEVFFKKDTHFVDPKLTENTNYKIPIISHASAGIGRDIDYYEEVLDYVELPSKITTTCDFATYVNGDSMEPKILDNDIIFIKKNLELKNGDIGLFSLNEQLFVKQLKINIFTNETWLVSLNKEYAPIKIKESDNFTTVGKVICKIDYNF